MSDVFRNTTVTLSADGVKDASEGLFADGELRREMQQVWDIECTGPDGSPATIHVRLRVGLPSNSKPLAHSSIPVPATELFTRAWVVQERLLSPPNAALLYGRTDLVCSSLSRCECRLQPGPPSATTFKRYLYSTGASVQDRMQGLFREWPKVVEQFTHKQLTYSSDRLPAIAGIAGILHNQTAERYFGGLWEFDVSY
jgi:hypothetical protein